MPSKRNTPQNVRDFAVVIGIKDYPGFEKPGPLAPAPLLGPENDARAFYDWLICSDGGGLPEENVKLIVSSLFRPPFPNVKKARPVITEVQEAFEDLQDIADENRKRREGWQVGRRLYIYMSGHGFAPKSDDNETALLMANATADRVGPIYHLLGKYTADWFYKVRFFEEVLLFMDCCRNLLPVQGLNKSFTDRQSPDRMNVKRFYALATRSSGLAKEMDYDGIRRGVFTYNLIRGLEGAASDPETKMLTAGSLRAFLYNAMPGEQTTQIDKTSLPPDIDYYPPGKDGFLIKQLLPPDFDVEIEVPKNVVGTKIEILDSTFSAVLTECNAPAVWNVKLKRGKYLVLAAGLRESFSVTGTGGANVSFNGKDQARS